MRASPLRRSTLLAALLVPVVLNLSCGGDSGGGPPEPSSVIVTPGTDTLFAINATQAFTAEVLDDGGTPIPGAVVSWSSSDPLVLAVHPTTGLATALQNGAADVIATIGDQQGSAPVTVAQVPTTVTVSPATGNFTFVGDTLTFTATVLDGGGSPVTPVQKIWTLNDNTIAVIDSNGLTRAKGVGIAMVTVVAIGPGGAKAAYAAITSTQPVASLNIRNQPTSTVAGEPFNPAIQVDVRDSGGAVVAGYSGAITLGVDSGPIGAALRGTRVVHAINGVSSFSGLSLERAGQHLIGATATDLAPDQAAPITVVPALAHHLSIISQPVTVGGTVVAGDTIPLVVTIVDRFENRIIDSTKGVTLFLVSAPAGGALYGDPAGDHHPDGTITFPGAHLELAMIGYVLQTWAVALIPDTTATFSVVHAAPYRIRISGDSGRQVGNANNVPPVVLKVVDAYENQTFATIVPVVLSAWWQFTAPAGKGQRVIPADTLFIDGEAFLDGQPFRDQVYFMRPGATALIASGPGLIPDTGGVWNPTFGQAYGAYVGSAQICYNDRYCAGGNDHGELGVDPALLTADSVYVDVDSMMDDAGPYVFGATTMCGIDYILPGSIPTVMCRGANDEGQMGLGVTGPDEAQLRRIPGATGWWRVAMGDGHGCALTADSTAACWGRNDHGQLGRGTTSANEPTPAAVTGGAKFKSLAAGGDHTCGVTVANVLRCWGANTSGQLGDSTQVDQPSPVAVVGSYAWAEVAAGAAFTCGIKTNVGRKVLCWGNNSTGQLGDITAGAGRIYPALVTGGLNDLPFALVAGTAHTCTLANATMICWGDDSRGQIGNGPANVTVHSPYGISLPQGRSVVGMAAGGRNTCALGYSPAEDRQTLMCWGANDRGQLGTGNTMDQSTPAEPIQ